MILLGDDVIVVAPVLQYYNVLGVDAEAVVTVCDFALNWSCGCSVLHCNDIEAVGAVYYMYLVLISKLL